MKGWDPEGNTGPRKPLPDSVQILDPPVDKIVSEPSSEQKEPVAVPIAAAVAEEPAYGGAQEGFSADGYAEPPAQPAAF
jgi:small subunit ribosomal protein S3e